MICTNEKANEKWCPMVRYADSEDNLSTNRCSETMAPRYSRCIGSECMMWRSVNSKMHGYCGLAGRPAHGL